MSGGLSATRLERLSNTMRGYFERGEVSGLVSLVARHGEVHVDTVGTKDIDSGAPMQRNTIFRIASMTKPVTAVAALILVEEAKLRLDDPVDKWLPELADRRVLRSIDSPIADTVPAKRSITLRDLLTFRMGMGAVMAYPGTYLIQQSIVEAGLAPGPKPPPVLPDEWMQRLATLPLLHQPGEGWMYHTGSDVLGVLIARVAGMELEAFFKERIFHPLGMNDTAFSVPEAKIDRLATSYCSDGESGKLAVYDEVRGGVWSKPPLFQSGGGGLVSTVDDYLVFAQMLLNMGRYGSERILSRPTVEVMTTDQLTPHQKAATPFMNLWDNHGWGFGVAVVTKRDGIAAVPGRYGWDGGLGTSWRNDPHENMIGILLTQRIANSPQSDMYDDFWTTATAAIED